MPAKTTTFRWAATAISISTALVACSSSPPPSSDLPDGFDVCETPLDGTEGANGFDFQVRIDVGNNEAGEEEEWDDTPPAPPGFELDGPYGPERGFGYVGNPGEASTDPSWTTGAWPYGGAGYESLHLSTRQGMEAYRFDVPDGVYAVTWHFIEKKEHWSGYRAAARRGGQPFHGNSPSPRQGFRR